VANHKSAGKAARTADRRRERNAHYRSALRTKVKAVREALSTGGADAASAAFKEAEKFIGHIASKGVIHKRTASRKISRLARALARQ